MTEPEMRRLEQLTEALGMLFYALIFLAFLSVVLGSPAGALLLLFLAAAAHVGRAGLERFLARHRPRAKLPVLSPARVRRRGHGVRRRSDSPPPRVLR